MTKRDSHTGLLIGIGLTAGILFVALQMIAAAPREPVMGLVQKIFYFHVPCALVLFATVFVAAGGSIAYLFKGSEKGDRLAVCASELGVVFGVCMLVSGPLWARVSWGKYWTWDARLTTSLLLFLMLIAYQLARKYGGPGSRKLAAALSLFAAVNVPLVYASVNIWRTIHPKTTVVPQLAKSAPAMAGPFWLSFVGIFLLWGVLLAVRMRLESARAALGDLELAVEDREEALT